jgi:RNA polymerase sigma factor FliA
MLYYTKELTMREIGEVLGVNESRISQMHKVSLQKMATALHESGVHSGLAF